MSMLLVLLGAVAALMVLVVRSLLVDEAKGQLQRCVRASVDATIAALPPELQDEWAEEWRADLEAVITMPLTALKFAYGLHRSVGELVGDSASAADSTNETSQEAVDDREMWILLDGNVGLPGARMLTPTELARETGLDRRDVISRCMEMGVPIFRGKIDETLFVTSHNATRRLWRPEIAPSTRAGELARIPQTASDRAGSAEPLESRGDFHTHTGTKGP